MARPSFSRTVGATYDFHGKVQILHHSFDDSGLLKVLGSEDRDLGRTILNNFATIVVTPLK